MIKCSHPHVGLRQGERLWNHLREIFRGDAQTEDERDASTRFDDSCCVERVNFPTILLTLLLSPAPIVEIKNFNLFHRDILLRSVSYHWTLANTGDTECINWKWIFRRNSGWRFEGTTYERKFSLAQRRREYVYSEIIRLRERDRRVAWM